ncbi:hypothetical protein M3231_18355 [Neobacillus mesonae]|nr:hypothetical protein [Neobacillus mesonae]
MKIELQHIKEVLSLFQIQSHIIRTNYFIEQYKESPSFRVKVILRAEFADHPSVVIKFIQQEEHPRWKIEQQSVFSEHMRVNGILTPKRYKSGESYCIPYELDHFSLDVTVEEYLGEEIKTIDEEVTGKIGQLMAQMHSIAEKNKCHIEADSIFNVTGYNEVSGYERFKELGEAGHFNSERYEKIIKLYESRMDKIKEKWPDLPRYATQGDYSINNLTMKDGVMGIFDYNIAGDETLAGDMVVEGLLIANEMDLAPGLCASDRPRLFEAFYKGYIKVRQLSNLEQEVVNDIYAVAASMWFTKIRYEEDSLEFLVERKETEKIESILDEMLKTLSSTNTRWHEE